MPPDKRKGPPGGDGPSRKSAAADHCDKANNTRLIPLSQLHSRPVHPDELPELRRLWWSQASAGHRLPAELGVIVVEGGAV